MSPLNRGDGPDEPSASKSEGEGKGKSMGDKQPLSPVSMSKGNEITPNGSKRKRKDWRALSRENGGVSRRFLRSDAKRAERVAGSSKGAGTRFNPAELEDVDWVKCGDDLQVANGNVGQLNGKGKKESHECDVSLGNGEEASGETENLCSGEHGAGERKEGDDVAIAESENEVKHLIGTKEKEGMHLLDVIKLERRDNGENEEEPEGQGNGGHEDAVTENAVPDKSANENIPSKTGDVDASCEDSEGATEKLKADTGPTDIEGKATVVAEEDMKAEANNVVNKEKDKLSVASQKSLVQIETAKEPVSRGRIQNTSSSKKGQKETLKAEPGPTDLKEKATVKVEYMKTGDKQFHVVKKDKKKLFAANKRALVQVESAIVEKRITRSSAAKQKVNDENVPEADDTTIVEGQMEEESSGLDQTDADDNELLEKFRLKKSNKKRSESRKSSDQMDYDKDFTPMEKRVRKKQANVESDRDGSVSLGAKRELPFKRKKLKMDNQNSEEKFKAARRSSRSKKPEVESEESDSSGHHMKRLRKKKEPKMEREDSVSDPDFLGSDEGVTSLNKRLGQLPRSKDKAEKATFSKFGSKRKEEVIKVQSLSELDDKPPKEAKAIVSGMIKDLLKEHGWTIEMRPRNGRDYNDQVHVSPEGTTHWSVTKAYYAFLQGEQATNFTPIPEELLGLLKRTVSKERCGRSLKKKNKLRGKKIENGKRLGAKSKKIKKKGKLKKKNKNEGEQSADSGINEMDAVRGRKKKGRLTLLARGSHKEGGESGENDYVPYEWKRTVLSWMIDLDVVSENGKVKYIDPNKPDPLAEGKISRDGIVCNCCGKSYTASDFAVHAGAENGSSCLSCLFVEEVELYFLQCLLRAWEKQCGISKPKGFFLSAEGDGVDQNDDSCGVCGDGGDLVCCDKCPSTFHLGCLGMEMLPSGDWHCPYCSCAFCMKISSSPLFSCNQCNDKFHSTCLPEKDRAFVDQDDRISFCGESCKKLFEGLEAILGVNHKMEGGFSWRLVRHITEDESSLDPVPKLEVRAECNAKVAVAMTVMDECFLPIDDKRSGIDLLQNVVYNCKSNFVRLNFRSFYTFLLERDDEIICVASVRIHGSKLAEMPFIGTRYMYRRQGMCRRLLDGIELALSALKVQKLIIPAITELVDTWTNVFGFSPLEGSEREELRSKSIVVFPGTGLLQKPMLGTSSKEDCNTSPTEGNENMLESSKKQHCSNGGMSPHFADPSCADMKPNNSGEGDLARISNPDVDTVQSVKFCGGSAEPDGSTVKYGGKLCGGLAEHESAPVSVVKSQEGFAEPKVGSVLVMESSNKAKVLNGADETSLLGCGENGNLQGCAKNRVHHLTGAQLASTDVVMAGAGN